MSLIWPLKKIQLEIVNKCNFRCPLCKTLDRSDGVRRRKMSLDETIEALTPILGELEEVTLYGTRGEPFLNADLCKIVDFLKTNTNARIIISTNGSLASREKVARLFESRLDEIVFAIDGADEESFSKYRVGGTFKEVLDNLKIACKIKKEIDAETKIVWQFIPMSHNEHQIPSIKILAKEIGVDVLKIKHSSSVHESGAFKPQYGYENLVSQKGRFLCPFGLDKIYIDPNGDCFPCCYAEGSSEMKIGNALETDISSIWGSDAMWELRRSFVEQSGFNNFCKKTCMSRARKSKSEIPL